MQCWAEFEEDAEWQTQQFSHSWPPHSQSPVGFDQNWSSVSSSLISSDLKCQWLLLYFVFWYVFCILILVNSSFVYGHIITSHRWALIKTSRQSVHLWSRVISSVSRMVVIDPFCISLWSQWGHRFFMASGHLTTNHWWALISRSGQSIFDLKWSPVSVIWFSLVTSFLYFSHWSKLVNWHFVISTGGGQFPWIFDILVSISWVSVVLHSLYMDKIHSFWIWDGSCFLFLSLLVSVIWFPLSPVFAISNLFSRNPWSLLSIIVLIYSEPNLWIFLIFDLLWHSCGFQWSPVSCDY